MVPVCVDGRTQWFGVVSLRVRVVVRRRARPLGSVPAQCSGPHGEAGGA